MMPALLWTWVTALGSHFGGSRGEAREVPKLLAGEGLVFVGRGQVRADTRNLHARQVADRGECLRRFILPDPDAAHAGVERHVDGDFLAGRERVVGRRFFEARDGWDAARLHDERALFRQRRAENQDRQIRHCFLKFEGLGNIRHREHLHALAKRLCHRRDAVPVGVGFHHRDDLHVRADLRPHCIDIVPHCTQIDLRPAPPWAVGKSAGRYRVGFDSGRGREHEERESGGCSPSIVRGRQSESVASGPRACTLCHRV
jgi:hypothetical protein